MVQLEDKADRGTAIGAELALAELPHILAGDDHLAGIDPVECADEVQNGAFPRSRRADNRDGLASFDLEAHVAENIHCVAAVGRSIGFGDVAEFDEHGVRGNERGGEDARSFAKQQPRLSGCSLDFPDASPLFLLSAMKLRILSLLFLLLGIFPLAAAPIDVLVMGDAESEKAHELTPAFPPPSEGKQYTYPRATDPSATPPSEVIRGGLGEPARRLLPRSPLSDMYGGELNFKLKVDPVNQNFFTMKLWGSDASESELILNCENHEIGRRHGNSSADLFVHHGGAWLPGRFWYRTATLPLKLTKGKTTVAIKIRSAGKIYDYNNKAYTPNYQYLMKTPSWQIYRVYSHAGSFVDPQGEVQGSPVTSPVRTSPGAEVLESWKKDVAGRVEGALKGRGIGLNDLEYFANSFEVAWTPGYRDARLLAAIIKGIDGVTTSYAKNNAEAGGDWGGKYGGVGVAVARIFPQLKERLQETVDFGGNIGPTTRQKGWSQMLRASVDAGRLHRRTISNQEIFCARSIYGANKGLRLVDPANALLEAEALRYPYEAAGLAPFLGDDELGGGPTPVRGKMPFGPNWFMVTTKGTTKEPSFVGSDYGEMGTRVYEMGLLAGDRRLRERGLEMTRARARFRFPGADRDGFRVMTAAEPVGTRNNYLPGHDVYIARDTSDTGISMVAREAAPDLAGWFQQQVEDGQLYPLMQREGDRKAPDASWVPDELAAALAKPKSGTKLPMATGAPDFAWADEENMVVAAKRGEERFFANMVWRGNTSINGAAMVFLITPQTAVRAEVRLDDLRFVPSGKTETGSASVDSFGWLNPPDHKLHPNGEVGDLFPIAIRPDLGGKLPPRNNDGGRGTGYTLCYGRWLVGMNGNYTTGDYLMKLPPGFASGVDLVTGKEVKAPVVLKKGTTVVFHLPKVARIPTNPWTVSPASAASATPAPALKR